MESKSESGFTIITNKLLEALAAIRVPGESMQLLLVVLRKTFGWSKLEDRISLSQFHEATNIPKPRIVRALAKLISMEIVIKNGKGHFPSYSVNMLTGSWQALPKRGNLPNIAKKIVEENNTSAENSKINCHKWPPQKRTETNTKEPIILHTDLLPICKSWLAFKDMRESIKKPLTDYAAVLQVEKLATIVEKGHDPVEVLNLAVMNSWASLYEPKEVSNGKSGRVGSVQKKSAEKTDESESDELTREFLRHGNGTNFL